LLECVNSSFDYIPAGYTSLLEISLVCY